MHDKIFVRFFCYIGSPDYCIRVNTMVFVFGKKNMLLSVVCLNNMSNLAYVYAICLSCVSKTLYTNVYKLISFVQ